MIDFRYHLVSIVSIFLALAVGIALGAGPLKGTLSEGITSEITTLRQEKADLNTQLKDAERAAEQRDGFVAASNRLLLAGRLSGQVVDLVVTPGADSALLKATSSTLVAAGAKVGATVRLENGWTDPGTATDRDTLATTLGTELRIDARTDPTIPMLAKVLAHALQPKDRLDAAAVRSVLTRLEDAGLLSVDEEKPLPATNVVVVASPVDSGNPGTDTEAATAYAALAAAFDRAGDGTVVSSNVSATPDKGASVVQAVRTNAALGRGVSTVDDSSLPMGQATIVYALLEQGQGGAGHYGLADGATAPYPALVGS